MQGNGMTLRPLALIAFCLAPAFAGGVDDLGPGEPGWDTSLPPAFEAPLAPHTAAQVHQEGHGNALVLLQNGSEQLAIVQQWGEDNRASVEQQGSNQRVLIQQVGTGNEAQVIQHGNTQSVRLQQWGDHQLARIVQSD
jgi:hypothetical protein